MLGMSPASSSSTARGDGWAQRQPNMYRHEQAAVESRHISDLLGQLPESGIAAQVKGKNRGILEHRPYPVRPSCCWLAHNGHSFLMHSSFGEPQSHPPVL